MLADVQAVQRAAVRGIETFRADLARFVFLLSGIQGGHFTSSGANPP